ncbi:DNA-binding phage protein [Luteibacter sp. Sphag1AF]|uniref:helix-turn-helix domain-containing protein n=1 Tax=Luteibacter sp. Sphag1AF TaxID=2587031 RepID=UPI0017B9030F|nr:helix-turn-helix transcriptional regulator [Luteibacter sp. Sphag1AF]MBB3228021.1 DNA-binding phage protein [Luteibacter sp. Sphag1AF]
MSENLRAHTVAIRSAMATSGMSSNDAMANEPAQTFAARVKAVIKASGSVSDIARRCGFSEGVVRSWRDGNTDPSRGRCVTMARTLGISLLWLAAGEGPMMLDSNTDDIAGRTESSEGMRSRGRDGAESQATGALDASRLASAMKLLQSDIEMAGGSFSPVVHADLVAEMYEILHHTARTDYADRMVAFHHKLQSRVQAERNDGIAA